MTAHFKNFQEFYTFYLAEHRNNRNRQLHFFGSCLVLLVFLFVLVSQAWVYLILLPIIGYGFAWVGHFFFEKNRPATFKHPFYSFCADWVMFKDILLGKIK